MNKILCIISVTAIAIALVIGYTQGVAKATKAEGYFLGDSKFFLCIDGNIYEWDNDYVR